MCVYPSPPTPELAQAACGGFVYLYRLRGQSVQRGEAVPPLVATGAATSVRRSQDGGSQLGVCAWW